MDEWTGVDRISTPPGRVTRAIFPRSSVSSSTCSTTSKASTASKASSGKGSFSFAGATTAARSKTGESVGRCIDEGGGAHGGGGPKPGSDLEDGATADPGREPVPHVGPYLHHVPRPAPMIGCGASQRPDRAVRQASRVLARMLQYGRPCRGDGSGSGEHTRRLPASSRLAAAESHRALRIVSSRVGQPGGLRTRTGDQEEAMMRGREKSG